ncbi:MAG: hypothetical protein WAV20_00130 [Blastocatellia bacterium]
MNLSRRFLIISTPFLLLVFSITISAQWDKKPYAQWSEREAQKVLNDSPWGRTQVFTSPAVQFQTGISGRGGIEGARAGRPPDRPADALHINFRIRFFSAKPVRQALSRLIEIKQKKGSGDELSEMLKNLASSEFQEVIIMTVSCDSDDPGQNVQAANALLRTNSTASLKNNTFLEIKGGKRIFLREFQPPRSDGFGARFIFERLVDGNPFITAESEEIHFFTELSENYRLDRRYKTKDMMFEGKLEY